MTKTQDRRRCCECTMWVSAEPDPIYSGPLAHCGIDFNEQKNSPRYCTLKNMYVQPLCYCGGFKQYGHVWEPLVSIRDLMRVFEVTEKQSIELKRIEESQPMYVISKVAVVRNARGTSAEHKVFKISFNGEICEEPTWVYTPEGLVQFLMFTCQDTENIRWRVRE